MVLPAAVGAVAQLCHAPQECERCVFPFAPKPSPPPAHTATTRGTHGTEVHCLNIEIHEHTETVSATTHNRNSR